MGRPIIHIQDWWTKTFNVATQCTGVVEHTGVFFQLKIEEHVLVLVRFDTLEKKTKRITHCNVSTSTLSASFSLTMSSIWRDNEADFSFSFETWLINCLFTSDKESLDTHRRKSGSWKINKKELLRQLFINLDTKTLNFSVVFKPHKHKNCTCNNSQKHKSLYQFSKWICCVRIL